MLTDPQNLTINTVATDLPRTTNGASQNVYTNADGTVRFKVRQSVQKTRVRREIRIEQDKIAADPISAVNSLAGVSVYLVIDEPKNGVFSDTEITHLIEALRGWLIAANYDKVLSGEY
uniref:Uncharacterized protein n=1 Tax=Beihai levi-like virus 1 TaxID=1922394 RepID=A0A1L3KI13_9VIRU|nr:hypothetical protein [Beihai levi-like virus 1]